MKDLCKKLGETPHSSIPPQPPVTSDEQFACDFEHAQIVSLGGVPHHNQPGVGTSSSMQATPPPNIFSSRGSEDLKGKQKQPSPLQAELACPPMEDEITPSNLYTDGPMTINELIIQGTMFPNFNGTEYPYRVLHLGQGNDSIRLVLFMRINNNLYAYGDKMIRKVIVGQVIQWEREMMGPIALYNTVEEIHKLYAMAYDEPEDKAPCICKAQDVVMYLNLWKRCRLETNEVMDLALKAWRPPIWASQKVCQKREVLRDKERASRVQAREGGPSRSKTVGSQPTLQGWIVDAPPVPSAAAAEELRPTVPLTHHVAALMSGGPTPNPYQRPPESSRSQGGAVPELPYGAPSIYAPVDDWVKFIHQYQNQSDDCNESFKLSRMFPRALGSSSHPNDDEVENVWLHELIKLLTVKGQYRALLEWAEVAPANGTPIPWEGEFTHSATVADVAAYLAANGFMYHNANDALNNGRDKDPNTKVIIDQMRITLNEPLPMWEHHSLEWIDLQACVLAVTPKSIAPYEAHPIKERDLFTLEEFTKSVALYDLSHQARGEGSNAGGVVPIPASILKEGEMEDDLRPM
ncbi:hypothetical protein EDC04DRAFT_2902226 [Pisolithus marmoratus]|nr:hypothetical protein EDC04DRAFT_2902226 [Pisolithus marmoratus]